jgi:LmbE family N-acetylglucosaminyl deacetylase
MIKNWLRRVVIACGRWVTLFVARRHRPQSPCLVLAPHADDETLGCGGTIAALRAQGLPVTVVIVTDGRGSDRFGRHPDEIEVARRAEAVAAAWALGVEEPNVIFLGFPDGGLSDRIDDLIGSIQELIDDVKPAEILVCSGIDSHPDHRALNRACALADHRGATVLEYLVWAWPAWPATALRTDKSTGGSLVAMLRDFVALAARARRSNIGRHRASKRAAIGCYPSQTGRGDAGGGLPPKMLRTFDGRFELFLSFVPEGSL